jgi:uncharacterized protein (DUF58 family)
MKNFVFFTLILFAVAALLRVDFFFTIFYMFVGVYILARLWSRRTLKKLNIERRVQPRAFLGEQLTVTLSINNGSRLPVPWLSINETFATVLSSPPFFRKVISLGSRETQTLEYTIHARRRGYYSVGPLQLETSDLLGINRRLQAKFEANPLIVYPRIMPISRLKLPTHSPQVILPTPVPLFQDTTRITGVKGYVPGDNPRHIHWPASARQSQVLVKQFETAIARDNAIFLNLNSEDYGRSGQASIATEMAIVAAASLANHMALREKLPVGLYVSGVDPLTGSGQHFRLPPDRGRGHLMQILEVLARVETSNGPEFLERVQREAMHLSWGTTVVIITSAESEALLNICLLLKRSGLRVAVLLIQPAAYSYAPTKKLPALNIPTILIERERDLEVCTPNVA